MQQSCAVNDNSRGILRLPDDILIEISLEFASLFRDIGGGPLNSPNFWTRSVDCRWIVVAHICHRWRDVVLAIPQLWTTISLLGDTDRVATTLRRSGQLPLTIFESAISSFDLEGKKLVLQEIPRIEHLQIPLNCQTLDCFIHLKPKDAPSLKTLELTYSDQDLYRRFDPDMFQQAFASWSLPSLTRLAFRGHEGKIIYQRKSIPEINSIQLLFRPTLVQLEIDALPYPISVAKCIQLLRTLPLLEKLCLGNVLERIQGLVGNGPWPLMRPSAALLVHFPYLREISLLLKTRVWADQLQFYPRGGARFTFGVSAADLLNHLVVPSLTTMHFAVSCRRPSENMLRFIFSALCEKLAGTASSPTGAGSLPPFSAITVSFAQGNDKTLSFLVQLETQPMIQGNPSSSHNRDHRKMRLLLATTTINDSMDDANLRAFFDFDFPLSNITTLRWHTAKEEDTGEECWLSALRAMPNLRDIVVVNSGRSFVGALQKAGHSSATPAGILPNLTRLAIMGIDWCPHRSDAIVTTLQNSSSHWQSASSESASVHDSREIDWRVRPFIDQVIHTFFIRHTMLEELAVIAPMCFDAASKVRLESAGVAKTMKWMDIPGRECLLRGV
ncbi:hypothetical protein BDY19DRAFT_105955 [Irpex rosettiformis]|uniref:Uncharacterized protein n=1 Tax=Irpex rosettiformis TaxID=378272 RepID=A0ACB8U5F5_9APHY|nr:hypothetical protein BDY19DRAFT_105955 [Irpex rosettiformis]